MVRTYKRKTDRALIPEDSIRKAVKAVLIHKQSIRRAAAMFDLKPGLVFKRVKIARMRDDFGASSGDESDDSGRGTATAQQTMPRGKYRIRQVFTDTQELLLRDYMLKASSIHYGLTSELCRKLAYEYALKLQLKCPDNWHRREQAGKDWLIHFLKKYNLSLRKPENTSLARAIAFNKSNVEEFRVNFSQVMDKYKFTPDRILNLDESGLNTVIPPPKVIAQAGQKQVGQVSSAERGEQVTFCAIITASGNSVPPVYLFPRVHMKDHFMHNSPVGALGLAVKNGYMTGEIFPKVLAHIVSQTKCCKENPILLLLDNHLSHISLVAVDYAKDKGIVLLSFPPHCTHRMQPLDVAVFGPFKAAMRVALNDFLRNNPGKTIGIQLLCEISKEPYMSAFSPRNITSGFSKPGIWPVNNFAFQDEDFSASYATDQPMPHSSGSVEEQTGSSGLEPANHEPREPEQALPVPSGPSPSLHISSGETPKPSNCSAAQQAVSPEDVWPLPKCSPTKRKKSNRAKAKSTIYTDTPEKRKLEEKEKRKLEEGEAKKQKVARKLFKKKEFRPVSKPTSDTDTDSEKGSYLSLSDDEVSDWIGLTSEDDDEVLPPVILDDETLDVNDFVLSEYICEETHRPNYRNRQQPCI